MKFKLDPTLNWQMVEIISLNNNEIRFKTVNKKEIKKMLFCFLKILNGQFQKKTIKDVHKVGDVIFVKKEKNFWTIKQYPKVNGGIIILDPYTGDVLALAGGFNFKTSEFNRVTQAKKTTRLSF